MMNKRDIWKTCRIARQYHFSAAHFLTGVPKNHQCAKMHGHNYVAEIEVRGHVNPRTKFVMDFHDLDKHAKPIIARLDHVLLNDIQGLENPTAEVLAQWIMDAFNLHVIFAVKLWETDKSWVQVVNADGLYMPEDRE